MPLSRTQALHGMAVSAGSNVAGSTAAATGSLATSAAAAAATAAGATAVTATTVAAVTAAVIGVAGVSTYSGKLFADGVALVQTANSVATCAPNPDVQ